MWRMWTQGEAQGWPRKKVTLEDTGKEDNPEELPYYMEAVENGYAGTRQRNRTTQPEEKEAQEPTEGELEEHPMREEAEVVPEEAAELSEESLEEPQGHGQGPGLSSA